MKIAVPVFQRSKAKATRDIFEATQLADIIELCLDKIPNIGPSGAKELIKLCSEPTIVRYRHPLERGLPLKRLNEVLKTYSEEKRKALLQYVASELVPEFIDIELNHNPQLTYDPMTKRIVSYHDFKETPSDEVLEDLYNKMIDEGADIPKIATMARSEEDAQRMLRFIEAHPGMIGICMGEHGINTRIYGPSKGGYLTFASLPGRGSAPGMLPAHGIRARWKEEGFLK